MSSLFFTHCAACGDPADEGWWIGDDLAAVPMFEIVPAGPDWVCADLGTLRFTGYAWGSGLIFRRGGEYLLLDTVPPPPGIVPRPDRRPSAADDRLRVRQAVGAPAQAWLPPASGLHDSRAAAEAVRRCMAFLSKPRVTTSA